MSAGRCAGCGYTNASCKIVNTHVMECPQYLELHKEDPAAALAPEQEYARWKPLSHDEREAKRLEALYARVAQNARVRSTELARWDTPPDLLD